MAGNIKADAPGHPHDAEKVFCIGLNKTGTTSLEKALKDLGYRIGSQAKGEMLLRPYLRVAQQIHVSLTRRKRFAVTMMRNGVDVGRAS